MNIRILLLALSFLLTTGVASTAQITLSADRADAFYEVGDSVYFLIHAGVSESVRYFIQRDPRLTYIASGTVWVDAGVEKRIVYKSRQPDMIVCTVQSHAGSAIASAAISGFDINAYEPEPPDFDAFWARQKARLRQIPMEPKLTLLSSSDYSTTYSIRLSTVAQRKIYGFISIPKGKGPFPAILTMPAFGDAANIVTPEQEIAERGGAISLTGVALLTPFYVLDIGGMQLMQVVHSLIAALMFAVVIGHIYLGSIGVPGSLQAMSTGRVDVNWKARLLQRGNR